MSSVFKLIPLKQPRLQKYKEEAMKKLFEFFSKQKGVQSPKTLEKVFKEVYGDDLNYKFFNKLSKEALNE